MKKMKSNMIMSAPGWYAEEKPPEKPVSLTIEIDGKEETVTAEDVVNLRAQQASATQKTQQVAAVIQAAEKFGMSPEDYVAQAEGAFGVMGTLMQDGVIDNTGQLLTKKVLDVKPDGIPPVIKPPEAQAELEERLENLEKVLKTIPGEFEALRQDQTYVIRADLQRQIQGKHPELNDDDVSRVFGTAMNDSQKRTVWQHAEELVVAKTALKADDRKKFAEEFGINLEQFDENALRQKSPGGAASHIIKGKKLAFRGKGEDAVTPMQAAKSFFEQQKM